MPTSSPKFQLSNWKEVQECYVKTLQEIKQVYPKIFAALQTQYTLLKTDTDPQTLLQYVIQQHPDYLASIPKMEQLHKTILMIHQTIHNVQWNSINDVPPPPIKKKLFTPKADDDSAAASGCPSPQLVLLQNINFITNLSVSLVAAYQHQCQMVHDLTHNQNRFYDKKRMHAIAQEMSKQMQLQGHIQNQEQSQDLDLDVTVQSHTHHK